MTALAGSVLVMTGFWYRLALAARPQASQPISFQVESGASARRIALELKKSQYLVSPTAFEFYVRANRKILQAGYYRLEPGMSLVQVVNRLSSGQVFEKQITIPEGWRVEQIGQLLDREGLADYDQFIKTAQGKEGFLFPDTYRIGLNWLAKDIVDLMEKTFFKRTDQLKPTSQELIIASIVEREAKLDEDRPKIAGVFFNRLKINLALEADPTVQYARDSDQIRALDSKQIAPYQFWRPTTLELNRSYDSQYNTYLVRGLPPGPISNPGLASLQAAVNPARHDFFYFFNLANGTTIYSKTLAEHNANKAKHLR